MRYPGITNWSTGGAMVALTALSASGAAFKGMVRDSSSGAAIADVQVSVKGSSPHTLTDARGIFTLDAVTGMAHPRKPSGSGASPARMLILNRNRVQDHGLYTVLGARHPDPGLWPWAYGGVWVSRPASEAGEAGPGLGKAAASAVLAFAKAGYASREITAMVGDTGLVIRLKANGDLRSRADLIYGSEIGAWDLDGGIAVNNATARQNIQSARIKVIRWGNWKKFDYMHQGQAQSMTLAQFNHALDGIRSLGAEPFIKLPPVWDEQCDSAPDYWNLEWQEEIVKQAGDRVRLYEAGNETDNYCGWWDGKAYAAYWLRVAPALKKYARSLGREILIGGPAKANNYTNTVPQIRDFLAQVRDSYAKSGDPDVLPDFVSTHTYPNASEDPTLADILKRIDYWGGVYDRIRAAIDSVFAGVKGPDGQPAGPRIKLADSEWDYTINHGDARYADSAFMDQYGRAMFRMFRAHGIWMANQFTLASHGGAALDMLNPDGTPRPLFKTFQAVSTADPGNP